MTQDPSLIPTVAIVGGAIISFLILFLADYTGKKRYEENEVIRKEFSECEAIGMFLQKKNFFKDTSIILVFISEKQNREVRLVALCRALNINPLDLHPIYPIRNLVTREVKPQFRDLGYFEVGNNLPNLAKLLGKPIILTGVENGIDEKWYPEKVINIP